MILLGDVNFEVIVILYSKGVIIDIVYDKGFVKKDV